MMVFIILCRWFTFYAKNGLLRVHQPRNKNVYYMYKIFRCEKLKFKGNLYERKRKSWTERWTNSVLICFLLAFAICFCIQKWEEFPSVTSSMPSVLFYALTQISEITLCVHSVASLCLTVYHPIDCNPPDSSVHGIFPARILEWVAVPSSRGSSRPRVLTHVSYISCTAGGLFTSEPLWKPSL